MNKDDIKKCLDKYDIIDYSEYSENIVDTFIDTVNWYYNDEYINKMSDKKLEKLLSDSWYMFINGYKCGVEKGRIYL